MKLEIETESEPRKWNKILTKMTSSVDPNVIGDSIRTLPHHLLPPCKYEFKGTFFFSSDYATKNNKLSMLQLNYVCYLNLITCGTTKYHVLQINTTCYN